MLGEEESILNPEFSPLPPCHNSSCIHTEGRGWTLWSYEEANAELGYTGFAFQLRVSEMSWVVSASVPIHSHCQATAQLTVILKGGGGGSSRQTEGIYRVVPWSYKSKCCFRSGRLTKSWGGYWEQNLYLGCLCWKKEQLAALP